MDLEGRSGTSRTYDASVHQPVEGDFADRNWGSLQFGLGEGLAQMNR
jgi:hypothetical protein